MSSTGMAKRRKVDNQMLQDFVQGKLDAAMAQKVAAFVEKHPKLQDRVAKLRQQIEVGEPRPTPTSNDHPAENKPRPRRVRVPQQTEIPVELNQCSDYEILKHLGQGGMGVVYLAKNLTMGRLEVIKVLNSTLNAKDSAKQRFVNEIQSGGRLNHPAIVTFYRVVPLDNHLAFAMEYVDGSCLQQYIKAHHPIPVDVACTLGQQIAVALQHAHENGLVHRDLKPANVMVFQQDEELRVKVLDFGLAKAMTEAAPSGLTRDGATLGTPEYMAPEQIINAARADIRSDIYSLGCTLYHILTGSQPFVGTVYEVMLAQTQKNAPAVNLVRPDVPEVLAEILTRMMAKDPGERFQTPREVQQALRILTSGTPSVVAQPDNTVFFETPSSSLDSATFSIAPSPNSPSIVSPHEANQLRDYHPSADTGPSPPAAIQERGPRQRNSWSRRLSQSLAKYAILISLVIVAIICWLLWSLSHTALADALLEVRNLPSDAQIKVDDKSLPNRNHLQPDDFHAQLPVGQHHVEILVNGSVVQAEEAQFKQSVVTAIRFQASLDFTQNLPSISTHAPDNSSGSSNAGSIDKPNHQST